MHKNQEEMVNEGRRNEEIVRDILPKVKYYAS